MRNTPQSPHTHHPCRHVSKKQARTLTVYITESQSTRKDNEDIQPAPADTLLSVQTFITAALLSRESIRYTWGETDRWTEKQTDTEKGGERIFDICFQNNR